MVQPITLKVNDTDMNCKIENPPSVFNGLEVVKGNPSIPVINQSILSSIIILILAESILVYNASIVQRDEKRRRYPCLGQAGG
jgi:hypothetical protein